MRMMIRSAVAVILVAIGGRAVAQTEPTTSGRYIPTRVETLAPKKASDVKTVQAISFFANQCPSGGGVLFDRLVVPPTVHPFTIPSGHVYVLTSVDWTARAANEDSLVVVRILVGAGTGVNGPAGLDSGLADKTGRAAGSAAFPTGIIVRSHEFLCIDIDGAVLYEAVAHGFLAVER